MLLIILSTTFFIQLFRFCIFFHKKRVFNVFYSWGQRFFYIYACNHDRSALRVNGQDLIWLN